MKYEIGMFEESLAKSGIKRNYSEFTVVNPSGLVIQHPKCPQGVIVVSEMDNKPVLYISETSDEETVNFFMEVLGNTSGILKSDRDFGKEYSDKTGQLPSTYEILANIEDRKDMK